MSIRGWWLLVFPISPGSLFLGWSSRSAGLRRPPLHTSFSLQQLSKAPDALPIWRKILSRESNIAFGSGVWQEGEEEEAKCLLFFSVQLTLPAEILCSPLSVCTDGG